jgi:hypothetical protein
VCVAQATFIAAPATAAQNQPEEIVVTGSRIRQNPVESVAPLKNVIAADIGCDLNNLDRFLHARSLTY